VQDNWTALMSLPQDAVDAIMSDVALSDTQQRALDQQLALQKRVTLAVRNVSELPEDEIEAMFVEVVGAGDRISIDDFILFVKSIIKC
jgi:hypothetical protein